MAEIEKELNEEIAALNSFKADVEKKEKEATIAKYTKLLSEEVLAARKKGNKKGTVILVIAIIVGFIIGFAISSGILFK